MWKRFFLTSIFISITCLASVVESDGDNGCEPLLAPRELTRMERMNTIAIGDGSFFSDPAFVWPLTHYTRRKRPRDWDKNPSIKIKLIRNERLRFDARVVKADPLTVYIERGRDLYLATLDRKYVEIEETQPEHAPGYRENARPKTPTLSDRAVATKVYLSKIIPPHHKSNYYAQNKAFIGAIFYKHLLGRELYRVSLGDKEKALRIATDVVAITEEGDDWLVTRGIDPEESLWIQDSESTLRTMLSAKDLARAAVHRSGSIAAVYFSSPSVAKVGLKDTVAYLHSNAGNIQRLWFSQDGETLFAEVDKHLARWDLSRPRLAPELIRHTEDEGAKDKSAHSQDKRRFFFIANGEVIIRNVETGKIIQRIKLARKDPMSLTVSADSTQIAIGYESGELEILTER